MSYSTRHLDDILNVDNLYLHHMVGTIYPKELELNKTNSLDTINFFGFKHFYFWWYREIQEKGTPIESQKQQNCKC